MARGLPHGRGEVEVSWSWEISFGDFASILGVLLALIGLHQTRRAARKSAASAEAAKVAAERARDSVKNITAIADASAAITGLEEVRTLHRLRQWTYLPDRYSRVKGSLFSLRDASPNVSDDAKETIQGTIVQISRMENLIERAISRTGNNIDSARLNRILSKEIDNLNELLGKLKSKMGDRDGR